MRIFISAGEPSGDLRASELVRSIRDIDSSIEFYGMGGPLMESSGVHLIKRIGESSVVGVQEALTHIPDLMRDFRDMYHHALLADAVILVDYPGYHLLLASRLLHARRRVFYYILPQLWAWGRFRISPLRKMEGLYSVLPFEPDFFRKLGVEVKYFGHPLASLYGRDIEGVERRGNPTIGLLPGSRKHEIRRLIPRMMRIKEHLERIYPDAFFYVSLLDESFRIPESENMRILRGKSLEIMKGSDVVIVASGTASLEAAILGTPAVVLYVMSESTWILARMFARVRWASLTNLILGREVFPEFIQHIRPEKVARTVARIMERRDDVVREISRLKSLLGEGNPVDRVAEDLVSSL